LSYYIALAGKGGTGKTSIASLVIRYLIKNGLGPVLAVDADSNANLGDSLGLEVSETVGSMIASFQGEKINIPAGMTKEAYLEYKLNDALVESNNLDLLSMGRGEGPECYCYPNLIMRKFIDTLAENYAYTVMDNEAGMEHLSRRTTHKVDDLLITSDHSVKGIRTVARIKELVTELKLEVKRQWVLINYAPAQLAPAITEELNKLGIDAVTTIPLDDEVHEYDLKLKPLLEMPDDSKAVTEVNNLMARLLDRN